MTTLGLLVFVMFSVTLSEYVIIFQIPKRYVLRIHYTTMDNILNLLIVST